jgi:hypothetical protein
VSSVRAMTPGYKVRITNPYYNDPLINSVSIHVLDVGFDGKAKVMSKDGTWADVTEGMITEPTLTIPSEAMEALVEAVDRWRGAPSHAKTEAAVLREVLAKEQARVDEVLHVVGKPIVLSQPGVPLK